MQGRGRQSLIRSHPANEPKSHPAQTIFIEGKGLRYEDPRQYCYRRGTSIQALRLPNVT